MTEGEIVVPTTPRDVAIPTTPMEMLSRALERGADITVLEKLMDLQERHERSLGRKAFDNAIAAAKSQIKPVKKNRTNPHTKKKYADMAAYAKEVDPVLAAEGLSYRFRTSQDGAVTVTCILAHRDGHSEETSLVAAPDSTGSKNSIQAIGSTLSYLQRYTLCAALGLAAEEDDDGASADGDEPISGDQLKELQGLVERSKTDIARFCAYLKVESLPDVRKSQYTDAKAALEAKIKPARKADQ